MHLTNVAGCCLMLLLVGAACAEDAEIVRTGGDLPTPIDEGPSDGGEPGSPGMMLVTWCEARDVLVAKCQRCHQEPPRNGAPMPLLTYDDTQAVWTTTLDVHDVMLDAVVRGFMPYVALNEPPTSLMPPVEQLTDDERATLLAWLNEGALPVGATDCP